MGQHSAEPMMAMTRSKSGMATERSRMSAMTVVRSRMQIQGVGREGRGFTASSEPYGEGMSVFCAVEASSSISINGLKLCIISNSANQAVKGVKHTSRWPS